MATHKETMDEFLARLDSLGIEYTVGMMPDFRTMPAETVLQPPQKTNFEGFLSWAAGVHAESAVVPMPPGVNSLYPTIRGVRRKSEKYKEWSKAAAFDAARLGRHTEYPVRAILTVEGKLRKGTDIDGKIKAVLDCLVNVGVLASDDWQHVSEVRIRYAPIEGGTGIRIQLEKA